jgi:parvulin-like peptidyl-prolyl isomerase
MPRRLLTFLLLGARSLHATTPDPVIATLGTVELHQSDLLPSLTPLDKSSLARDSATLAKLIRSLLVQRVILQQALEKKWDEEPAIQPLLKSTREAAITDSYLKSVNRPPDSYPSETELKTAYENGRAALTVPRSFRLAQIFIAEQTGSDKRLAAAQQRLKQNPASFAQIAREISEEKESASRDGEIGWLTEQQIQPEILAQLPKLKLNTVSSPVRLKDGWHILKVLDMREPFTPIFDQVRVQLAQRLRAEKSSASIQAYVSEVLHKHPVAINEVALSKLLLHAPSTEAAMKP